MIEIRHRSIQQGTTTQDAYDDLYELTDLQHRDSYYLWLLSLLNAQAGSLLLDISCGAGRLVNLASQQEYQAIGTDFSIKGLRQGIGQSNHKRWLVSDGEQLPFATASIDYVTNIGSLEHYEHPILGVREIARVLKPGGRACILLPNSFGLLGNIKHVLQKGEVFDDGQPLQRYGTRATWEHMLRAGHLHIERVVPYGEIDFPRTRQDLLWLLKRPQKIVRGLLAKLTPLNLANHFVFICRSSWGEEADPAATSYMTTIHL